MITVYGRFAKYDVKKADAKAEVHVLRERLYRMELKPFGLFISSACDLLFKKQ
jgi:hypothetical protein